MTVKAPWRAAAAGLLVLSTALAAAPTAQAHHSFAIFDQTRQVTLVGVVRRFEWTNPHTWIELEVVNSRGGREDWTVTALSPNLLRRNGWTRDLLKYGDKVTVVVHPLKSRENGGNLVSVKLADGRIFGGGAE